MKRLILLMSSQKCQDSIMSQSSDKPGFAAKNLIVIFLWVLESFLFGGWVKWMRSGQYERNCWI